MTTIPQLIGLIVVCSLVAAAVYAATSVSVAAALAGAIVFVLGWQALEN